MIADETTHDVTMMANKLLEGKFNKSCFTLSKEDIYEFDKRDNGPINNVITGINEHCFGVQLCDDSCGVTAEAFYITSINSLRGDIIRLDLIDENYFQLLLHFCVLLSNNYQIDAINAFNIFQNKIRSFLEKLGYFTTTNLELKSFAGQQLVMLSLAYKGVFLLEFIEKAQFYREFFKNNYKIEIRAGNEYVYLMVNEETSLIKIGTSKNPKYRERTLHSQEPKISVIAIWSCKKEIEKELHDKFKHKRVRCEWFRLTLNELKQIEDFMDSQMNITGSFTDSSIE